MRWPTFTRGTRRTRCASGHEWAGTVASVGNGVDPAPVSVAGLWATPCSATECVDGAGRVTSTSARTGRRLAYAAGRPGALAEQVAVPSTSLHAPTRLRRLRARCSRGTGCLCFRCRAGCGPRARGPGTGARPVTIGLLAAMFAAGCRRRGAPDGSQRGVPCVRPQPRVRARSGPRTTSLTSPLTR